MTGIFDLPAELIVNIVSFLDDEADIFATRLANKYLERSSISYFGKRFFRKKGYLITTPSINVLKSVANHDELRKYVQHVWFNPDCYTYVNPRCAPEEEIDEDGESVERVDLLSEENKEKWDAYLECITDHGQLLSKPKLVEDLTEALSKLPNLLTIGMRRSEKYEPWGWKKLMDAIGEDPRVLGPNPSGPKYTLQAPTKLFVAIVSAVVAANVELKRLYTDVVEIDNILPENLTQDTLDRACRGLLYLEFNATRGWLNKPPNSKANYIRAAEDSEWGEGLLRLFKAAPHLLELGLQIFPDLRNRQVGASGIVPWKGSYPYIAFEKLTKHASLRSLTRLKLEKLTITPDTFKAFIEPSQLTLTSLKIRDIRLLRTKTVKEPWYPIFEFLRDSCPNLVFLLFYHLLYDEGGILFAHVPPPRGAQPVPRHAGGLFTDYEHMALEATGREEVEMQLRRVAKKHWYDRPIYSYDMDPGVWHTDTSDEEW
jgi:hypothetical protein